METVTDFVFLGSKITTDGDGSHKIKRRLLLGRKAMTNLNTILKSRDITLPTKFRLVKAVQVGHNFSSKKQASFNFMAAVTICSDFGAQKDKVFHCFHVSLSICHEVMDAMIFVF